MPCSVDELGNESHKDVHKHVCLTLSSQGVMKPTKAVLTLDYSDVSSVSSIFLGGDP